MSMDNTNIAESSGEGQNTDSEAPQNPRRLFSQGQEQAQLQPARGQTTAGALQDLLQVLRAPRSPETDRQILEILKANPNLTAAFIKQREVYMILDGHNSEQLEQNSQEENEE